MKAILRPFVFVFISFKVTQYIIGGFEFFLPISALLLIVAISILYFAMPGILGIVGLPRDGVGYLILSFILTGLMMYILTVFIPGFSIVSTTISQLKIFGFVLPSKNLTVVWATIFSALLFTVIMWFLNWLCTSKK
ncbi:hypothetical protein KAZ57_03520 [Patescibacteria group bacterium]|nr:hypothetical protein [Patescibacteria group bacterium]